MPTQRKWVLSDELLAGFSARAAKHDRESTFFTEDLAELKQAGFLTMAVPVELGGRGLNLAEVCLEVRRLGYHAPSDALATLMHLYWTGVAADLWRAGDSSLEWLLKEAVAGEIFASGHAESGSDQLFVLSNTKAERVDGGYKFTGHKHFTCLSPVWTRLGLHGLDKGDADGPRIVHAFLPRDTPGIRVEHTWNVMGMRATQSNDTVLEGVFVPDKYVACKLPPGISGANLFVLEILAWTTLPFANMYFGLAQRALDMAVKSVKAKGTISLTRTKAHHPEVQHTIAEMVIELEAIAPHVERVAQDWCEGVRHGGSWMAKLAAAKYRAVEGSWKVVDQAMEMIGAFGIFNQAGLERIFRDARMGRLHPPNAMLTRELVAKTALGIEFDTKPRWG